MRLTDLVPSLTPVGWATGAALAFVAAVALWWLVIGGPAHDRLLAAQAHAGAVVAQGDAKAASDAVGVVAGQAKADAATDELTRKNADEISHAPGADVHVDPALDRAGRLSLCRRQAYRDSPRCRALLKPGS